MEGETSTRNGSDSRKIKPFFAGDGHDLISRLPDHVIIHILSLLPAKDLVTTMLVPRLCTLWPFVHTLFLDYSQYAMRFCDDIGLNDLQLDEKFWNLVRNVFLSHEGPTLHEFRLRVPFHLLSPEEEDEDNDGRLLDHVNARLKMHTNEINACVRFALKKKVGVLCIDLGEGFTPCEYDADTHYTLPTTVFRMRGLTELKLGCCGFKPKGKVSLDSLKILSLHRFELFDSVMDQVLRGCPLLENLSLIDCFGLDHLNITNSRLRKLKLQYPKRRDLRFFSILDPLQVQISSPYFVSLDVSGWVDGLQLTKEASLEDAYINFYALDPPYEKHNAHCAIMRLLHVLRHTQFIDLAVFATVVLLAWNFTKLPCLFNWKRVVLRMPMTDRLFPGLVRFLTMSHCLETLTLHISDLRNEAKQLGLFSDVHAVAKWILSLDFDVENYYNIEDCTFCCLEHLTTINILGLTDDPHVLKLVEFLLNNATKLESLKFSNMVSSDAKKMLEISQKLLSFRRVSPRAVIHFS